MTSNSTDSLCEAALRRSFSAHHATLPIRPKGFSESIGAYCKEENAECLIKYRFSRWLRKHVGLTNI